MKKLLFTLVFLLSSLVGNAQTFKLGDVNRDSQVDISDVLMVVDIILKGYTPLTLSSDNVVVDYGSSAVVNILSGYGPYDITCSDENLVGVSLNGTLLSITGKAVGTAVVTVALLKTTNPDGLKSIIPVKRYALCESRHNLAPVHSCQPLCHDYQHQIEPHLTNHTI